MYYKFFFKFVEDLSRIKFQNMKLSIGNIFKRRIIGMLMKNETILWKIEIKLSTCVPINF